MEYWLIAAEWWVDRLKAIPGHPDANRNDVADMVKISTLIHILADSIKEEVEKWGDMIQPYSIDTTYDAEEPILTSALEKADIKGAAFPVGVLMEISSKNVVVCERTVLYGEN